MKTALALALVFSAALFGCTNLTPEQAAALEQDASLAADAAQQIYTHEYSLHATPTPLPHSAFDGP
jgi:hypothetical protein